MDLSKNAVQLIYLISFMDLFAVGLIFPILSPYIRSLGVSHLTVGILSSTYSALQVLSGPIIGSWSDVRGRKSVFFITLSLSAICYFFLGFCASIASIFAIRVITGIVKHTQTLNKAIVGDLVPKEDGSKVFGKTAAFSTFGFVVGPVIGGHLSDYQNGFTYICTLASFLFLINIGLVHCLPDVKTERKSKSDTSISKTIGDELKKSLAELRKVDWKLHWVSFTLKFLFVFSTSIFFMNQSLYLKEKFDLPQKYVGYTISLVAIIGVSASFFFGSLTKRFYPNDPDCTKRAFHCFLVLTGCMAGLFFVPNYYFLAVILIPFGVANAVLRIVTMEIMFRKSTDDDRGTLTGASDSVMSLGRFAAPLSAGIIGDLFSENAVMLFAMVPALIGTGICYFLNKTHVKKE